MQHVIKKQVIDVLIRNRKEAYRLQQLLSDRYRHDIVPMLSRVFDGMSRDEEVFYIDKLEIDLGTVSEKDILKGEWLVKIEKLLLDKLKLLRQVAMPGMETNVKPACVGIAEQWFFYIREGRLPWNGIGADKNWLTYVLEALAVDSVLIAGLRKLIKTVPFAAERIVLQHNQDFLVALMEVLTGKTQKQMPVIIDEVVDVFDFLDAWEKEATGAKHEYRRLQLWHRAILYAASENLHATYDDVTMHLFRSRSRRKLSFEDLPEKFFQVPKVTAPYMRRIIADLHTDEKKSNAGNVPPSDPAAHEQGINEPKQSNSAHAYKNEGILSERGFNYKDDVKDVIGKHDVKSGEDTVSVSNAGLVLLHPFLQHFFRNLQLVHDNEFRDLESRQRALYVLHYIATGNPYAEEYELVVPKILCSYPLKMPVYRQVILTEDDKREAQELLLNVVMHWSILKKTSPDALREAFLQRKGTLNIENDTMLITMEQSGIDVLLDDLPWNLNIIKLPWRKDILKVHWR